MCPLMFHCDRQGQKIGLGGHGADFVVLSDALIMKISVRQTVLLSKFYFCFFHMMSTRTAASRLISEKCLFI